MLYFLFRTIFNCTLRWCSIQWQSCQRIIFARKLSDWFEKVYPRNRVSIWLIYKIRIRPKSRRNIEFLTNQTLVAHVSDTSPSISHYFSTAYRILQQTFVFYIFTFSIAGVEIAFIATFFLFEIFSHCFLTYRSTPPFAIYIWLQIPNEEFRLANMCEGEQFPCDAWHRPRICFRVELMRYNMFTSVITNVPISFRCYTFTYMTHWVSCI